LLGIDYLTKQLERQVKGAEEKLKRLEMHNTLRERQNKEKLVILRESFKEHSEKHEDNLRKQQDVDLECFEREQEVFLFNVVDETGERSGGRKSSFEQWLQTTRQ
jgi:predicted Holliday junction resolvase-like endonuclease